MLTGTGIPMAGLLPIDDTQPFLVHPSRTGEPTRLPPHSASADLAALRRGTTGSLTSCPGSPHWSRWVGFLDLAV